MESNGDPNDFQMTHDVKNVFKSIVEDVGTVINAFKDYQQMDVPTSSSKNNEPVTMLSLVQEQIVDKMADRILQSNKEIEKREEAILKKRKDVKQLEDELKRLQLELQEDESLAQQQQISDEELKEQERVVAAYQMLTQTHFVCDEENTSTKRVEGYIERGEDYEVLDFDTTDLSQAEIAKKYWETVDKLYKGECKSLAFDLVSMGTHHPSAEM